MKRHMTLVVATGALLLGTTGVAGAGEVTGNGDPTPIASYQAGSICSFSGLNDNPEGDPDHGPLDAGKVQSFGEIVQEVVKTTGRGAAPLTGMIKEEGPGVSCRGYASQRP